MINEILKEFESKFGNWKDPFLYPEVYPWLKEKLVEFEKQVKHDFLKRILPKELKVLNKNAWKKSSVENKVTSSCNSRYNDCRNDLINNAEKDGVTLIKKI